MTNNNDKMIDDINNRFISIQEKNNQLSEQNSQLIGHQNQKQKIQLHQQIKKENYELKNQIIFLERDIKKWKKLFLSYFLKFLSSL